MKEINEHSHSAAGPVNGLMTYLPVDSLHPHPDNPRKDLGDLTELADSIRANGIFQNLTVIPVDDNFEQFTVVIGHRRLAAAKLAGLTEVPCVISQMTVKEQMQTMLLENMQRAELTVYEQAQGFQMMLDLGSTVEEVAEKSGFSVSTVRRRVKMMELDQDVLKEVSARQLSLSDFDRLAQIEDIAARNECLSTIGTSDFNARVSGKLRKQETQKKLPLVMELLTTLDAKEIPSNEHYSSKYSQIDSTYISDWAEGTPLLSKKVSGQLFYYIEGYSSRIVFCEKVKRAEPVRRSAEEIEREKQIAEAWSQLDEKAAVAYDLRSSFVKTLSYSKRNAEQILRGALIFGVVRHVRIQTLFHKE
ncbi:MAG: ParB/RepB/Spo0J family partition protein [Oscillospiraceae bacterium]|nr:ParB/RepB/Spo0J family partition protein [Oscillospiraceae bacterium]